MPGRFSGIPVFVSKEGSVGAALEGDDIAAKIKKGEMAIVTYWKSFEQHEKSHADKTFREKFSALNQWGQIENSCSAGFFLCIKLCIPDDNAVAATVLCPVERNIRLANQPLRIIRSVFC